MLCKNYDYFHQKNHSVIRIKLLLIEHVYEVLKTF